MTRDPINQYAYVMAKGDGNKGASYKYTWRPDWRLPPGVNQGKVFLQVAFWLGLAAIPVWGLPWSSSSDKTDEEKKRQDIYMIMKQKNREERLKWVKSDDMPYK